MNFFDETIRTAFEKSSNYKNINELKSKYTRKLFVIFHYNNQIGNYITYYISDFVGLNKRYVISDNTKVFYCELPWKYIALTNK